MADLNPLSWWRRFLALPNDSRAKTFVVAFPRGGVGGGGRGDGGQPPAAGRQCRGRAAVAHGRDAGLRAGPCRHPRRGRRRYARDARRRSDDRHLRRGRRSRRRRCRRDRGRSRALGGTRRGRGHCRHRPPAEPRAGPYRAAGRRPAARRAACFRHRLPVHHPRLSRARRRPQHHRGDLDLRAGRNARSRHAHHRARLAEPVGGQARRRRDRDDPHRGRPRRRHQRVRGRRHPRRDALDHGRLQPRALLAGRDGLRPLPRQPRRREG